MYIYNKHTTNSPLFFHAPGSCHKKQDWYDLSKKVVDETTEGSIDFPDAKDVTIITFVHGNPSFVLDEQLRKAGIGFVELVSHYGHKGHWQNHWKIKYTYRFLQEVTTPYVLSLDAIDVLATADLTGLVDRFLKMDCDILFGATTRPHPADMRDLETELTPWKYLNAGTILGKTEALKDFFGDCDALADELNETHYNNEQRIIKTIRRNYPNAKCDVQCELFQTVGGCKYDLQGEFVFVDPSVSPAILTLRNKKKIRGYAYPDKFVSKDGRVFEGEKYSEHLKKEWLTLQLIDE
jgi:hypothetical protein